VFDEFRNFAPGAEPTVIDVAGRRVGLAICEDIWVDGGPVAQLSALDVSLVVVLNGSPFEEGKSHVRRDLAARRAREALAPLAYVNLVGGQDDLVFDGGSFVVGAHGDLLARAPDFVEHLLVWELGDDDAPATGEIAADLSDDEAVYRAVVTGLAGYASKNGFRSVTLGLSGGIDSALVAAIAADALGGENVVGIAMPSAHSSEHSVADAKDLAERIGADYRVLPIAPTVEAFESTLPLEGVAAENIQARVRGMLLMGVSNTEGHLVLATGNKSELAVGYSTIYGDAVGGYAPIKDVDKSRVWQLARWRNDKALADGAIPPIPESSITKPPSAELSPGQKDSDSLPDYAVLDEIVARYVDGREDARSIESDMLGRGIIDRDELRRIIRLIDLNEYKRFQLAIALKVKPVALGRGRRRPIVQRYRSLNQS